jgi:hypothetical protein
MTTAKSSTSTKVKTVAFAFTRPTAVVLIGKNWTDDEGRRYRMHVYPSKDESKKVGYEKDRPNVMLVTRPDKVRELLPDIKKIHRVILLGPPEEVLSFGTPLLDAVQDDKGKYVSAPRAGVDYFNKRVENDATLLDLSPPEKKTEKRGQKKKKKKKEPLPKTLSDFLDAIEADLDDGDVWEDLERPVMDFLLRQLNHDEFQVACKRLVKLGVKKRLAMAYFKWIAVKDAGNSLASAFDVIVAQMDEGGTVDVASVAESKDVNPEDLVVLANMYKGELEEDDDDEEGE